MSEKYTDKVQFLTIYIDEAHPLDGWMLPVNKTDGVCYRRPKIMEERVRLARNTIATFSHSFPVYVDLMDNNANQAYAAWPERIYVLVNKKIAFKGGPGPFGYNVNALEEWLATNVQ